MRALRALLVGIAAWRTGQELRAVVVGHELARVAHKRVGNAERIGTRIGDDTRGLLLQVYPLEELLRDLHRLAGREAETLHRILLHARGDKRRQRPSCPLAQLDVGDAERSDGAALLHRFHLGRAPYLEILALDFRQLGFERYAIGLGEQRLDRPELLGLERLYLTLAVNDDAKRHGLHPAGRKPAAHDFPEQRRDEIADQPVEHPARPVRIDLVHINLARGRKRLLDAFRRNLVQQHALHRAAVADFERHRIGDCLPFSVRVARDVNGLCLFGRGLEFVDHRRLAPDSNVVRLEPVLDVDPEPGLRQVRNVPPGREHVHLAGQQFRDCPRLGRRLHNQQFPALPRLSLRLRHGSRNRPVRCAGRILGTRNS